VRQQLPASHEIPRYDRFKPWSGLPTAVANGVFGTTINNYFSDLWNAAPGTVPNDTCLDRVGRGIPQM
jgi:hypothetical protein